MPPGTATFLLAPLDYWIIIELVVPDHIVERIIVDFVEGCTNRVRRRVARATVSLLQRRDFAACKDKLLAETALFFVVLWRAAERARPCRPSAFREGRGVEFENKPPVNLFPTGTYKGQILQDFSALFRNLRLVA